MTTKKLILRSCALSGMVAAIFCTVLMAGVASASHDPIREHGFTCFKVKDSYAVQVSMGLVTELQGYGGFGACNIYKSGIKKHCISTEVWVPEGGVDVSKPNAPYPVTCPSGTGCDISALPAASVYTKDLVCYRLKCIDEELILPTQEITDMIGTRTLTKHKRYEVCVPADNSANTTTTTTTTLP